MARLCWQVSFRTITCSHCFRPNACSCAAGRASCCFDGASVKSNVHPCAQCPSTPAACLQGRCLGLCQLSTIPLGSCKRAWSCLHGHKPGNKRRIWHSGACIDPVTKSGQFAQGWSNMRKAGPIQQYCAGIMFISFLVSDLCCRRVQPAHNHSTVQGF